MVQDSMFHIVKTANVVPRLLRLHHVNRIDDLLRLLLLRVELHVPSRRDKVLYRHRDLRPVRRLHGERWIPELFSKWRLLRLSYLSEHLMNVTRRERASSSNRCLAFHDVQQIFTLDVTPGFSLEKVLHNREQHVSRYAIIETDLC